MSISELGELEKLHQPELILHVPDSVCLDFYDKIIDLALSHDPFIEKPHPLFGRVCEQS